jgi:hypothetical protein
MTDDCPSIHNPRVLKALLRAGIIQQDTDIFEAFCVWGRVISDAEVWRGQVAGTPADQVEAIPVLRVLAAMTKQELAALKDRIL